MSLRSFGATVWMKCIATLCSRYATPPPLWEKFSSYFIFLQFSHRIVQIWKMSKKELKNEGLDSHLRNLHTFEILWRISQVFNWSKSTSYWTLQIWKMSKKELKNEGLVANLRNLHSFELFRSENIWSKNIWLYWFFGTFFFHVFLIISCELFYIIWSRRSL